MTIQVKYFHSGMTGAPTLTNVAGSLVAILDACLKDGFNLVTATTLTVTDEVATMVVSTGHGFETGAVALLAGATPSGLNGDQRVAVINANTLTFPAPGISDGAATGTITAKMAPGGWTKPFSATNKGAYKSADPAGTGMYLRVDDTGTSNARVVGYESMSDVDTGLGPFPSAAQMSGGGYWPKAHNGSGTRPWVLATDGRFFMLAVAPNTSTVGTNNSVFCFGDLVEQQTGDPYAAHISFSTTDIVNSASPSTGCMSYSGGTFNAGNGGIGYAPRAAHALGGSLSSSRGGLLCSPSGVFSGAVNYSSFLFPNLADNGLILVPVVVGESGCLRGYIAGALQCPQPITTVFESRQIVAGEGAYQDRNLMALRTGGPASATVSGMMFIDITGPWR